MDLVEIHIVCSEHLPPYRFFSVLSAVPQDDPRQPIHRSLVCFELQLESERKKNQDVYRTVK